MVILEDGNILKLINSFHSTNGSLRIVFDPFLHEFKRKLQFLPKPTYQKVSKSFKIEEKNGFISTKKRFFLLWVPDFQPNPFE